MEDLVRAAALRNYLEVAREVGLNPQPILRAVGLSRAMIEEPERQIPAAAAIRLLEISAADSHCVTFGLRMAETRQLSAFGAVSLLLSHQRTLRDALNTMIQYRHLLNQSLALHVEDVGRRAIIREELTADHAGPSRQAIELAIGVLARMCAALLGEAWRPISVNFTHSAPDDLQVHRRVFRCRIEFDSAFNGIVCDAATLSSPNPVADPVMARYAEQFMHSLGAGQAGAIVPEVRKAIYLLLPLGRATIEQVALGLGLSVRTLQRQLLVAQAKYADLLNAIRAELVTRYMGNPNYSIQQVGELLGYATPTSFTRWFNTQFGSSPRQWRKQQRI